MERLHGWIDTYAHQVAFRQWLYVCRFRVDHARFGMIHAGVRLGIDVRVVVLSIAFAFVIVQSV